MSTAVLDANAAERPPLNGDELYEIVHGQRVEKPMSAYATWLAGRIHSRMAPFAEEKQLGTVVTEMLFILDAGTDLRRRPDVAFVSSLRWPLDRPLPRSGDWEVVPDLAIEVISPNDPYEEVIAKKRDYFNAGVRQVWLVLPNEQEAHVHVPGQPPCTVTRAGELDGGDLLPGFRLALATLFGESAVADANKP